MAVSKTMIANLALGRIGISQQISSIDSDHNVERICKLYYDISREYVLGDRTWPFAQRYVTLALVEEEPNEEWQYSYRYPANCLRIDHILDGTVITTGQNTLPWVDSLIPNFTKADVPHATYELGSDDAGKLIYTDISDARAKYLADITDTAMFDALFVDALAWRLASELAGVLTRDPQIRQNAVQQYMLAISSAHAKSLNESNNTISKESSFITAGY